MPLSSSLRCSVVVVTWHQIMTSSTLHEQVITGFGRVQLGQLMNWYKVHKFEGNKLFSLQKLVGKFIWVNLDEVVSVSMVFSWSCLKCRFLMTRIDTFFLLKLALVVILMQSWVLVWLATFSFDYSKWWTQCLVMCQTTERTRSMLSRLVIVICLKQSTSG